MAPDLLNHRMDQLTASTLDVSPLLPAPSSPAGWPAWRNRLTSWRSQAMQALEYDGALYRQAAFQWSASAYACGFVFMYDTNFYDRVSRRYTIDSLLEHAADSFGGYDAVV